ncbi:hypothetical protein PF008_g6629 [Phytophthora fragariae]|nr:hypothetical protein PF008_g6629 [Phytophthora fragariae]
MKSSATASVVQVSSAATTVATNAPSTYTHSSAANWATGKPPSYQTCAFQTETSSQSKCALHSLANCILCAGVKAMTRKVVVPTPQASSAKTISSFDSRGGNHVEDRAADQYRRYTLDERILNQPKLANQW